MSRQLPASRELWDENRRRNLSGGELSPSLVRYDKQNARFVKSPAQPNNGKHNKNNATYAMVICCSARMQVIRFYLVDITIALVALLGPSQLLGGAGAFRKRIYRTHCGQTSQVHKKIKIWPTYKE